MPRAIVKRISSNLVNDDANSGEVSMLAFLEGDVVDVPASERQMDGAQSSSSAGGDGSLSSAGALARWAVSDESANVPEHSLPGMRCSTEGLNSGLGARVACVSAVECVQKRQAQGARGAAGIGQW